MYFLVWISWTVIVVLFFKGIIQSSFAQQNLALANIDNIVIIIINFIIIIAILIINATINTMTIKLFLNLKKNWKISNFQKNHHFKFFLKNSTKNEIVDLGFLQLSTDIFSCLIPSLFWFISISSPITAGCSE